MQLPSYLSPNELLDFLVKVAQIRPVFIWGPPGIGKSSMVEKFAESINLPLVSLLGSQIAPEDLIGVPHIMDGRTRFCPPKIIAQDDPYCLFLDELNISSTEVQKAFYSLILEKRIGEYTMPEGSVVIGAGNSIEDSALARPMPSALINRMTHVQMAVSAEDWLIWAEKSGVHPWVIRYIQQWPDHLWSTPPKEQAPFSTPRTWHMLSDALNQFGEALNDHTLETLTHGCLTAEHADQFKGFVSQSERVYGLDKIVIGDAPWPNSPEDSDILKRLAESFRTLLIEKLPSNENEPFTEPNLSTTRISQLLNELANIDMALARNVVKFEPKGENIPGWLIASLRDSLPHVLSEAS